MAVREGNDILGIQNCDGSCTMIRYLRDPNTPDGQADIKQHSSGSVMSTYTVGSFMFKINDSVSFNLLSCCRLIRLNISNDC